MKTILALLALAICLPATAQAQQGPFTLPKLAYPFDSLEPAIDKETMQIHYSLHHQAYINKLNDELLRDERLKNLSLEQILGSISKFSETARNNAGGHWNHSFFWTVMTGQSNSGSPSPALQSAIIDRFGSMDAFRAEFEKAGAARFGSGWVWLVVDPAGKLQITSTPNQDNPLMDIAPVKGTPILANDIWEHAYYLKYKNLRADYLRNWWRIVNWPAVSANYEAITKK